LAVNVSIPRLVQFGLGHIHLRRFKRKKSHHSPKLTAFSAVHIYERVLIPQVSFCSQEL